MKIEERFTIPFPRGRVWAFLHNTDAVVRCLPGAELTEPAADGRVAGRFSVKLGPIAVAFAGEAAIAFDETAKRGEITGSGSDRGTGSRAKGSVSFALAKENGATQVDLAVDYTLAGALAQFNRGGIVKDLAARLTAQFADELKSAITADAPPAASTPPPLDAGNIFVTVMWDRLRLWLLRLLGRG
jgi:carbon monoxide dehydrogenase subunit G